MKITVIVAFWKRHQSTAIMLDNLRNLKIDVVAVGSEGAHSRELAEAHGAVYFECENQPLGRKWQRALTLARDLNPEAVMVLGSDNIANAALFERYSKALDNGAEYCGLYDAYQFNPCVWTLIHWPGYVGKRAGEPIGSARCFSKSLLDRIGWQLWDEGLSSSLDWSATQRINAVNCRKFFLAQKDTEIRHLGVKLKTTMSASLHTRADAEPLDPLSLVDWFGDDIGKRILKCQNT